MMFVRGFILGLDVDFVAPSSHPLLHNDTKYDFVAMVPLNSKLLISIKNVKNDSGWCENEQNIRKRTFKLNSKVLKPTE
jgi:O-succinylbenzoic acid--CoA ligase